jgi:DNA-binding transcriptional ArsR family regulator
MSKPDEEIYSTMFSSLKHPARRKILRMLSEKSMPFSQMLEELGVSSSHLTYHLENLGELVSKTENGQYRLSTFGEAAVSTMKIVEEAPAVPSKRHLALPFKWKTIFAVFLVLIILLSSMAYVQFASFSQLSSEHELLKLEYDRLKSWSAGTDDSIRFLQDVLQINVTAYEATLIENSVVIRPDLGGIVEERPTYSLVSSESQITVDFRFRNDKLSRCLLSFVEGAPILSQPPPSTVLEAAKSLLQRLRNYDNAPYMEEMSNMLDLVTDGTENTEIISGNMKLTIAVIGTKSEVQWSYTENGIDFQSKSLSFIFENRVLTELSDGWFLFTIGSTTVSTSREEAIEIARNYVKTYSWTTADGTVVNDFIAQDEPVSCVLLPHVRGENSLALIPYWYVTLYLDKEYPDKVDAIAVGLWADTGQVAHVIKLSV